MIKRTRDEWKALVEQWKASGKTITAWCHEHQIHKNTFIYWIKGGAAKKTADDKLSSKIELTRSNFTELSESQETGICIEYQGIRIHLNKGFDVLTFKSCLSALRGIQC